MVCHLASKWKTTYREAGVDAGVWKRESDRVTKMRRSSSLQNSPPPPVDMHLFYDVSIETNMWENLLYTTGHFTPDARTNIELLAYCRGVHFPNLL